MLQINSDDPHLIHLHLDYNNLHSLLPDVFNELNKLASLTLAGNPLIIIDRSTSFALTSLPMLKVKYKNNDLLLLLGKFKKMHVNKNYTILGFRFIKYVSI